MVCEKPLATTVEDARRLTTTAGQTALVATVPFVYRFYATVREARARIAAGEAGPLRLLHGTYLQDWLSKRDDSNWRIDPQLGGASRAFGDIGVHWCDLMEFATGHRITRLIARMLTAFDRRPAESGSAAVGTEDAATVLFETDQGACGAVVISQVSPGRKNRLWFSFDGAEASFSFDQENPDSLWIGGRAYNQTPDARRGGNLGSRRAVLDSARRAPAGLSGLLQRLRGRHLCRRHGSAAGRAPDLRRRPASGDPDPGGRRLRQQPGLGGGTGMKLGFLTACLPHLRLEEIAAWAAEHRFEALEVAAWPDLGDRPFTATHIDVADLTDRDAEGVRELFDRHGLTLSSLAFYDNNLHPDPTERKAVNDHVLACIDAAARLGCPTVGTFVGRDPDQAGGRQPPARPRRSSRRWSTAPASRA